MDQSPLTFQVDPEHGAFRLSMLGIFFLLMVVTFFIMSLFISDSGLSLIALIVSFAVAAIVSRQIESRLQARWPSGRALKIDQSGIALLKKETVESEVNAHEPMSILLWRFPIKRRTRVPKGWFVIGCAVEQDDRYLPVYTFMSPQDTDTLNTTMRVPVLVSEKETKKAVPGQDSLRLAGEQRRLRQAETHRWTNGAEMSNEDFRQYLERLNEQFPQWMPINR
ncbi:MAG: hypothetical protein H6672_18375 [Anaerolineaceae bacterium]|nr:hypothetical protein [Anaerolineaceae bacterium]